MRTAPLASLAVATALLLGGCKRDKPSTEYMEASGSYTTLLAELGDEAYADERMAHIEELLRQVPSESSDATAANQLLGTIGAERRRVEAEAAEHQKALDRALQTPELPAEKSEPGEGPPAAAAAAVDAGPPGSLPDLQRGIGVEELRKVSGDCFGFSGPLRVRRGEKDEEAEIYKRRETGMCPVRYPQYPVGKILVFVGGKLMGAFDEADLKHEAAPPPPLVAPPAPQGQGERGQPGATGLQGAPGFAQPGAQVPSAGEQTGPGPTEP